MELDFDTVAAKHRPELFAHCRHMLGRADQADDAVQETLLRAWRAQAGFEGRSSTRTWLYRIATNVCLDTLGRRRDDVAVVPELAAPADEEPEAVVVDRERVAHAAMVAVELLPPRQRAALVLHDVLRWTAVETASLLDTTPAAVNSALQRARATLAAHRSSLDDLDAVDDVAA